LPEEVLAVTREQFEREMDYGSAMSVAREMFGNGLIDRREFNRINMIFRQKFAPPIGGLMRDKP
jgi:uncharacterized membrane protein